MTQYFCLHKTKMMRELRKSLGWNVYLSPIEVNKLPTGKNAVVRDDNNQVLSFVSDKYSLFDNLKLKELCLEISNDNRFELIGFDEFQSGKKVLGFLKLKSNSLINAEKANEFLVVGNSFDKTRKLFIGYTNILVRCENQFTDSIKIAEYSHRNDIPLSKDLSELIIQSFYQNRKEITGLFERFINVPIKNENINELRHKIIGSSNSDLKSSRAKNFELSLSKELDHFGMNAWGLFNAVTDYTSNKMKSTRFGTTNGASSKINDVAFNYLKNLK